MVHRSVLLAAFLGLAWAQTAHQHHPPESAEEYARVLEDPGRDEWQKPHEVVTALDLKPGQAIADIGAGTGYFARRFAWHAGKVGPPVEMKLSEDQVIADFKGAGFRLAGRKDFLPYQYFLVFE